MYELWEFFRVTFLRPIARPFYLRIEALDEESQTMVICYSPLLLFFFIIWFRSRNLFVALALTVFLYITIGVFGGFFL